MDWDELDSKYGGKSGEGASSLEALDKKFAAPMKATLPATKPQAEPVTDFSGNLRIGPLDTGIPLPQSVNKGLAQIGSGLADWGLAARQMMASDKPRSVSDLVTGQTEDTGLRGEAADKRKLDAPLNAGVIGTINSFAGKAAPALGVPVSGLVGGVLSGAAMGAFEPVAGNESRGVNTALSGALGGVIPGGAAIIKKVMTPAAGPTTDLARKAVSEYGIPLGPVDVAQNRFASGLRSVLNDTPFVGSVGQAQNSAKQAAFNKAVGGQIGADAASLTPEVMTAAKGKIVGELNRVWDNNSLKLDPGLIKDYSRIGERVSDLNPEQQAMVIRQMQKLLQKADQSEIPGSFANNWQSELRLAVEGEKGLAKDVLNDLRQSTLRAFNRGVSPADAAALTKARTQYGNFKTLEPLMTKGELGVAGRAAGDVPAALLSNQVNQAMGSRAVGTPMGDLASIGSRFLADRVGRTGGDVRAAIQNGAIGSALSSSGALAGIPWAAATGAGAAASNWALGAPSIARKILEKEAAPPRGLLGSPQVTPAALELLRKSLYLSPVSSLGLLGQ